MKSDGMEAKIALAVSRLRQAIAKYEPVAVVGLFSGGHDSLSACYVASLLGDRLTTMAHIDTGIGVPATQQFVVDTCKRMEWPLEIYRAVENTRADGTLDPQVYEEFVRAHGFPGPAGHGLMYVRLKERALRRIERRYEASARGKRKRYVMYVSGCRSQESERRMGHVEEVQIEGRRIWVAPIHDWTKLDTTGLIEHVGLERNPVVDLIHKSGECLCGAFAKKGELAELGMWPLTRPAHDRIVKLQEELSQRFPWGWEGRPPREKCKLKPGMLCHSCDKAEGAAV